MCLALRNIPQIKIQKQFVFEVRLLKNPTPHEVHEYNAYNSESRPKDNQGAKTFLTYGNKTHLVMIRHVFLHSSQT